MKYSKEERLEIGRRIYEGELSLETAAVIYDINKYTARDYFRLYKANERIAMIQALNGEEDNPEELSMVKPNMTVFDKMSREELVEELIKARLEAERAKKMSGMRGANG